VAALHLAPPGLPDDRHDLSPVLVPAVALGMVLQPAIDELGVPLGKPALLNQPGDRLLWVSLLLAGASFRPLTRTITGIAIFDTAI
jgi:hypothetical protein